MMISRAQVQDMLKVYGQQPVKGQGGQKVAGKSGVSRGFDEMLVSSQAKDFQVAKQAIANTPDIREEQVANLQEAIRTGTYQVSNGDIAEKMLARSIVDVLIK